MDVVIVRAWLLLFLDAPVARMLSFFIGFPCSDSDARHFPMFPMRAGFRGAVSDMWVVVKIRVPFWVP